MSDKGNEGKRLFIIDGSSVFYRAFHAIQARLTSPEGMPTNAVYGFTQTLRKILNDYGPEYIAVAFDSKGPTHRHEAYEHYKAERPEMPDDLSVQIPFIKRVVEAFNIPVLEMSGFEADDIMATIDRRVDGTGVKVVLITGDKDMYQLIDDDTVILDYNSGREYGPEDVEDKFGVGPGQMRDLLALAGDSSDNIPGVPGVGPKTAAKLLKRFGSFEGVFENLDEIPGKKVKENLGKFREQAELSRELATLHFDVPVEGDLEGLRGRGMDTERLRELFGELGFTRLVHELAPAPADYTEETTVVRDGAGLEEAARSLRDAERAALSLGVASPGHPVRPGWATLAAGESAWFIPLAPDGVTVDDLARILGEALTGGRVVTDDAKTLHLFLRGHGVVPVQVGFDTSIASYLINPSRPRHTVEALSLELLGAPLDEPAGKKRGEGPDERELAAYAGKKARTIIGLSEKLNATLEEDGLGKLYREMELPLAGILAEMEIAGIKVDGDKLTDYSGELATRLDALRGEIYSAAGCEFNINSPKQLSAVLFDTLGLKPVKKTKTGFSTDEEVLTRLAPEHDVPRLILAYRGLSKLKSTYVDAIVELIDPATGRIHTSFNQTVTATGRLSSSRPNLQNIPVRGPESVRIREAFVAREGCALLSADYSQIELRIVAHLSGDPTLVESFSRDEDIHTRTASEIFDVDPAEVTGELRRRAKAINFGIIYGMGPFGLSTELGITVAEATDYIESYFAHYSLVREFIEKTVAGAEELGYTTTLFGRRRYVPELKSPIDSARRFGMRVATNTPVQGSAADIIKAAMINIDERLRSGPYKTDMILQIHDELVFEAPEGELDEVSAMVRAEMEGVVSLKVPVKVNLKTGPDWSKVE